MVVLLGRKIQDTRNNIDDRFRLIWAIFIELHIQN